MAVDRRAVVSRHMVEVNDIDPASPLSVGNGELCLTVDPTGFQTFPDRYPVPDASCATDGTLLGTLSQWGWHSVPAPADADLDACRRHYRTPRGSVRYLDAEPLAGPADDSTMGSGARWLRANPHRLDLARVGLVARRSPVGQVADAGSGVDGVTPCAMPLSPSDLTEAHQVLDLWSGVLTSRVELAGERLEVTTACHPERDVVGWRMVGAVGRFAVRIAFPYGSQAWGNAADWTRPELHESAVHQAPGGAAVDRSFDGAAEPTYRVVIRVPETAEVVPVGAHELLVLADGAELDLVVGFFPAPQGPGSGSASTRASADTGAVVPSGLPDVDAVLTASREHWCSFWSRGAALDLSGSRDPRAHELERRVVLSQYLTAINCAGACHRRRPGWSATAGAAGSTWRCTGGTPRTFRCGADRNSSTGASAGTERALPVARQTARPGIPGPAGPSRSGPTAGRARARSARSCSGSSRTSSTWRSCCAAPQGDDVVERYLDLVEATAASHGRRRGARPGRVPTRAAAGARAGVVRAPARPGHDPTFELAYWCWALGVAQVARTRGLARVARWDQVARAPGTARRARRPVRRDRRRAVPGPRRPSVHAVRPRHGPGHRLIDAGPRARRHCTTCSQTGTGRAWGWDFRRSR